MIRFTFIIFLFVTSITNAQTLFANINGEKIEIVGDTITYKERILKHLFSENGNSVALNKLEIRKQITIGERKDAFYYILVSDYKHHIKVAKWLDKRGTELYLDNEEATEFLVRGYLTCIGTDDCDPQIAVIDGKMHWGCSTIMECKIDDNNECRSTKSVITAD